MTTIPGPGPRLAALPAFDCWQLLEEAEIARVAWSGSEGVAAVVPINYAVSDGALWSRPTPTSRLGRECGGRPVTVEIDGLTPATRSGWSVVVRGTAELV